MLGQAERLIELKSLFEKSTEDKSSSAVFAFVSGKGGTGKTFLSLNISYELSKLNKKVLYVDMDFNLANAHLFLNINPSDTLFNFFTSRSLISEIIFPYNRNLHMIFGDSGKLDFPDIDEKQVENLLIQLRKLPAYDFIILDLSAGAGKNIINTLALVDQSLLISTTEPTAVMDAYVLSKLMKYEKLRCGKNVIMNKCKSIEDGELAYNNLNSAANHFLKEELNFLGCALYNDKVLESVSLQKLFAENNPGSPLLLQIRDGIIKISENLQMANIHQRASSSF